MKNYKFQSIQTLKLVALVSLSFFISQKASAQFDTIPTNKAPKATYITWKYSAGVTDITDNAVNHSVGSAFELNGNNVDIIYAPTVKVTSTGNVTGIVKFNLVNYQETSLIGKVAVSVLVDGGTSNAVTYTAFTIASGTNSWASYSFSGNFLSGVHTYTAFFSNPSNNPIAVDDLNFGFTGATSVELPVSLSTFTAVAKNNQVFLNWSTATESNNAGFYLERSNDDGNNFSAITFVATKANNGTSDYNLNYNYTDVTPINGKNYYRLKQTDLDGKAIYSAIIALKIDNGSSVSLKSYPNPAIDNLTVSGAETGATLKVISFTSGQTVLATTISSSNINVSNLLPGVYILETTVKGILQTLKFVKQ